MDGPIRAERWLTIAFLSAIAVHLAVVLSLPYFVAVDGAAHLGGAAAFWDSVLRGDSIVGRYAFIQLLPATNLIPDLPAGLLVMAIGPQLAEKLLIGGLIVGLPMATAYAVRGMAPSRWWLAFLVISLSFTFTLHYGFYPFCYGVLGLVIVMGYVVRNHARWTRRSAVVLTLLLTGTYAAHVLPFAVALLFLGLVAAFGILTTKDRTPQVLASRWGPAFLAALPGIALSCYLVAVGLLDQRTDLVTDGRSTVAPASSLLVQLKGALSRLRDVLSLGLGTVTFDVREVAFTMVLAGVLGAMLLLGLRRRTRSRAPRLEDAFLAFAVVVVAAIVVLPADANFAAGGSHLSQRLAPLPVFGLLLWLAAVDVEKTPGLVARRMPWLLAAVSVTASAGLLGLRLPCYIANSQRVEAYVSVAPCLATEATMVQVNLGRVSAGRTDPLTADTGRLASLRGGWDIGNIGAALPFFALRNRPETDPYRYLVLPGGSIERIPPAIDPAGYRASTPGKVDYVLVYGRPLATSETLMSASWQSLGAQLDADYAPVATSPDSMLEVYESRADPLASAGAAARARAGNACRPAALGRGSGFESPQPHNESSKNRLSVLIASPSLSFV